MNTRYGRSAFRQRPPTFSQRFVTWCLQHVQALVFSLGQLWHNPLASLLTAAVIGISLALPAGFYVILENAHYLSASWGGSVQIAAFLKMDIDDDAARRLAQKLAQRAEIQEVKLISRNEALEEYHQHSGFAEALEVLEDNPLPALLLIRPRLDAVSNQSAEALLEMLKDLPEIDTAQYDQQWVQRLNAIIRIVQRAVAILAVFLATAVMLIIGNTIRMLIYHRRSEIEIAKLFGATDSFIRRPFLYSGIWYGLGGGLIAWLLVTAALTLLAQPVGDLTRLYTSSYILIGLSLRNSLLVILGGVLFGLIGSWVALQRYLKAIEPV
jgi:cell division transport system permease protein